jgi:DNA-binding NarL/FixJ family response regulator
VVTDVRMPPDHADDGLRAAIEIRRLQPATSVVVLSHYVAERTALELVGSRADGVGYLLKDRVRDLDDFVDAVRRVARGGSALDPEVVTRLLRPRAPDPLACLSAREREVLALIAEGRSNHGVAQRLVVSDDAVEKHVRNILRKLAIPPAPDGHRRVLAVLAFLRGGYG